MTIQVLIFNHIYNYRLRHLAFGIFALGLITIDKGCTSRGLRRKHGLPVKGKIRFIPRTVDVFRCQILRRDGEFIDKFDNRWGIPKGAIPQGEKHWDVQLSSRGKETIGHWSKSGKHVNVTEKGTVPH